MNPTIIFEDSEILVIEKPCGVVVNRADSVKEETIQDWMESKYLSRDFVPKGEDEEYFQNRSGIVHRLDRETSGVMILAKTPESFVELLRQFRLREVKKVYLALTHGIWQVKKGLITAAVGRMRQNRKKMGVREDGRPSETEYEVKKEYHDWLFPKNLKVDDRGYAGFSLVEFKPKTGRTHQIRVHAKLMGHPIVGDYHYSGRKRSRADRKWAGRILLHAKEISFLHPQTHKPMNFNSQSKDFEIIEEFLK